MSFRDGAGAGQGSREQNWVGFGVRAGFKGTKQGLRITPGQNMVRLGVRSEVLGPRLARARG